MTAEIIITEIIPKFISDVTSSGWFLVFKFIVLLLDLFFIGFIIFALTKTSWFSRLIVWDLKEYMTFKHYGVPRIDKKWVKIKERLELGTQPEAKLAIIEAEAILDDILKKESFPGKTFGERLSKINTVIIKNIEEVKEAHQIRSDIIHDPSYRLDIKEAKRILDVYEKALVDLQAL